MRNGPYTEHDGIISAIAEGALTARSFVKKGTANSQAQPVATSDNENALGYVGGAVADTKMASIHRKGRVECISDGAVEVGDWVCTGDAVTTVRAITGLTGVLYILGQCVEVYGDGAGADGKTVIIDLNIHVGYAA